MKLTEGLGLVNNLFFFVLFFFRSFFFFRSLFFSFYFHEEA